MQAMLLLQHAEHASVHVPHAIRYIHYRTAVLPHDVQDGESSVQSMICDAQHRRAGKPLQSWYVFASIMRRMCVMCNRQIQSGCFEPTLDAMKADAEPYL